MATNTVKTRQTSQRLVMSEKSCNKFYKLRVMKDIKEFYTNGFNNIHISPDDNDIRFVHAVIRGPERTPYENGFFYFLIEFDESYPIRPPTITLMTTEGREASFIADVFCNSDDWSPVYTLTTILLTIESLMSEHFFDHEFGFKVSKDSELEDIENNVIQYNEFIIHETIRVAVIWMLTQKYMPEVLNEVMFDFFKNNYQFYEDLVLSKIENPIQTNDVIKNPLNGLQIRLDYNNLLSKLRELRIKYDFQKVKQIETNDRTISSTSNSSINGNNSQTTSGSSREINDPNNQNCDYSEALKKYMSISIEDLYWDELLDKMNIESDYEEVSNYDSDSDQDIDAVPDEEIRSEDKNFQID